MNVARGKQLRYDLFLDPTRQLVWGDGSGGTQVLHHDSPKNGQTYTAPVYARIYPLQDPKRGDLPRPVAGCDEVSRASRRFCVLRPPAIWPVP
jgi:Spore Coat Protein U domain